MANFTPHPSKETLEQRRARQGKTLCKQCHMQWHPSQFSLCWKCFMSQPITLEPDHSSKGNSCEGFESSSDYANY